MDALDKTVLGDVECRELHVGRVVEALFGLREEARGGIGKGKDGVGREAAPACTDFEDARVRSAAGEQMDKVAVSKVH